MITQLAVPLAARHNFFIMNFKRKAKRVPVERRSIPVRDVMPPNGFGKEMPPQKALVEIYFDQKGLAAEANSFYDFYHRANWCSAKGTPYRNWKLLATDWIFNFEQEIKLRKRQRENMLSN